MNKAGHIAFHSLYLETVVILREIPEKNLITYIISFKIGNNQKHDGDTSVSEKFIVIVLVNWIGFLNVK